MSWDDKTLFSPYHIVSMKLTKKVGRPCYEPRLIQYTEGRGWRTTTNHKRPSHVDGFKPWFKQTTHEDFRDPWNYPMAARWLRHRIDSAIQTMSRNLLSSSTNAGLHLVMMVDSSMVHLFTLLYYNSQDFFCRQGYPNCNNYNISQ